MIPSSCHPVNSYRTYVNSNSVNSVNSNFKFLTFHFVCFSCSFSITAPGQSSKMWPSWWPLALASSTHLCGDTAGAAWPSTSFCWPWGCSGQSWWMASWNSPSVRRWSSNCPGNLTAAGSFFGSLRVWGPKRTDSRRAGMSPWSHAILRISTNKLFTVYLKFKLHWKSYVLSDNPEPRSAAFPKFFRYYWVWLYKVTQAIWVQRKIHRDYRKEIEMSQSLENKEVLLILKCQWTRNSHAF